MGGSGITLTPAARPVVDSELRQIARGMEAQMYASINFKTKKQLKEAVASGMKVTIYAPGLGSPKTDGREYLEGPWYPQPHTWYAQVEMKDGYVVKVK